jgi:hypothetical protein
LEDWVLLLNNAKGTVESLKHYDSPGNSTDGANATDPLTKKLLKDLFNLSKHKEALKVLGNIQLAALHVACMMKGTVGSGNRLVGHI